MTPKTLSVRARGPRDGSTDPPMVQNHERLEAGTNSFIGMAYREVRPGEYGFVVLDEVVKVPNRAEYLHALRAGDLLPADQATAEAAGVKFDAITTTTKKDGNR